MSCLTETRVRIVPGLFMGIMGNVGDNTFVVLALFLWLVVTAASQNKDPKGSGSDSSSRTGVFEMNAPPTPDGAQNSTGPTNSATWLTVILVLLSVLCFAAFIVMVKRRVFRRHQSSYRETLVPDEDAQSQISPDGTLTPYQHQYGRRNTQGNGGHDDDGFIEDNYITSSEKEGTEKEEELQEESDDELYIDF